MSTSSLSAIGKATEIYDTSFLSIMKCDIDIRKDLYANVVWHHHVPSHRRAHDRGDHCVGTIQGGIKIVAPLASAKVFGEAWRSILFPLCTEST